jgi:Flp pilus assembly protein TadB
MPLSEHEQRILRQIEQELASDPSFADRAGRISRHRMMWLVLGLVVGIAATVVSLAVSFWLAFAAFVGVLVLGVMLENELRIVSRDKLANVSVNAWLGGARRQQPPRSE